MKSLSLAGLTAGLLALIGVLWLVGRRTAPPQTMRLLESSGSASVAVKQGVELHSIGSTPATRRGVAPREDVITARPVKVAEPVLDSLSASELAESATYGAQNAALLTGELDVSSLASVETKSILEQDCASPQVNAAITALEQQLRAKD